jgi:hypothetical protein
MLRLTLYTKPGCHLCEEVEAHLLMLQQEFLFEWERCDISLDPPMYERYKHAIPVVAVDGREALRMDAGPIDRDALRRMLRANLPRG